VALAKNSKHPSHVKTVKVSKPVKSATATAATTPVATANPAAVTTTPAASTVSKPAKTIKASRGAKKIKVAHRHNGHHLAMAKTSKHVSVKHASHVRTAKVSKPIQHANPARAHKQVAHVAKDPKVIAN
jgi:hypothetical protein